MQFDAQVALASHVDYYLDEKLKGRRMKIADGLSEANSNFSRMGYCFPMNAKKDDLWVSWHQDHSLFTTLNPNVCFDDKGNIIDWDTEDAGLFVMNSQTYEV
eukprot:CAMPEP_0170565190 /NCGR_PEP_ID=MMETSP0211-20121228/77323_1 /TAXON_ID=311385 /ORGANISM="Pseudokeronopsis sp., Strain OXSARD2" /LENGTH=101 /DNA_ID=CAMNT_0010885661 /DNA_START=267 /DNA_END=572 /DNA_ORIENTATION=+